MPTNQRQKDVESHIIGSHAHKLIIWKYDLSTLMHANDSIIWTKTKNHGIVWTEGERRTKWMPKVEKPASNPPRKSRSRSLKSNLSKEHHIECTCLHILAYLCAQKPSIRANFCYAYLRICVCVQTRANTIRFRYFRLARVWTKTNPIFKQTMNHVECSERMYVFMAPNKIMLLKDTTLSSALNDVRPGEEETSVKSTERKKQEQRVWLKVCLWWYQNFRM